VGRIASEALIERLADWGVDTVFGLPGDGINGIMEGLRGHQDRVRFVLVHHEEAAAFMATTHAKATGRVGVCLATSGPGGIHLLNGLYDAKLDHMTSGENPAAAADARQHARQEIAAVEASVARRARHLVRWLAVPAGALAGWLIVRRRPRR